MSSIRFSCPVGKQCGGCQLLHLDYAGQLKQKQQQVEKLLAGMCKVEPIIGMKDPFHYRNKIHSAFTADRKGNVISGVYAEGTHRVVPVEHCLIEDERADAIIATIRALLPSFKLRPYNEDTGMGFLRHVLIRTGRISGQIMVVLVTGTPIFPGKNNFVKALRQAHPEITTIVQNINNRKTSMVLGDREQVLYGKGFIVDRLCGLDFAISPKSFYQINPVQTEILYGKAVEFAGLRGGETVLDAYCGIGTIGMIAASQAEENRKVAGGKGKPTDVIGVELNPDAVKDAIGNAKRNNMTNIRFHQGDAGQFMRQMAARKEKLDVVFMDPPRAGSDQAFLDSVAILKPEKVVYVSCDPETLARDLKYITKKGYAIKKVQPVDMFPATGHVETVCLLSKLQAKQHIEIDLDMDELDLTVAEKKATYDEIKAYVLEHSGLKVSSLYIAQVKQKCGIIERENYNKPKSEDAKQPQCPPDKEKAIKEALKHFGMI